MKKYLFDYNDSNLKTPNLNTISSIQSQYASPKTHLPEDLYKSSSSFLLNHEYNDNNKNLRESPNLKNIYNSMKSPEKNISLQENNNFFTSPKTFSGVKKKYKFDSKLEDNISSAKEQSDEALNRLINVRNFIFPN